MQISVIVFDLGNVLIPFDYNRIIDKLNNISDGLGDKFYASYKESYHIHRMYERWELSNKEFLGIMLDWTENKISGEEFCRIYSDIFSLNEDVISLLPILKKNYKLVLLSNTNYIHQKYGWEQYGFLKNFDKLVLSHETGAVKPEEKIYKAVEKFSGKPPGAHIFIDDILEYAEGAKKLGWKSIHFKGYKNLVSELNRYGIKTDSV